MALKTPGLPETGLHLAAPLPSHSMLMVLIDTEEEFDWQKPFDRKAKGVSHVRELNRIQDIFDAEKIVPAYLLDYPIASTRESAVYFRQLASSGHAEIGAHLHPWVTPPHTEAVNAFNSYAGNLPLELEREKLALLTETIDEQIGVRPRTYKAGRYGISHQTIDLLIDLGFTVDTSAMPGFDLRSDGGPNFSRHTGHAHWLDADRQLLELPTTGGYIGALRQHGPTLQQLAQTPVGRAIRLGGILSRLNMSSRVRLSPEGFQLLELQALTHVLSALGSRIFSLNLHSPTVAVGHTCYSRSVAERDRIVAILREYIRWFRDDFGGRFSTPQDIAKMLRS